MKTKKEIKEKIEQLEKRLETGKPLSKEYPLERTESFLGGIKWVLNEDEE